MRRLLLKQLRAAPGLGSQLQAISGSVSPRWGGVLANLPSSISISSNSNSSSSSSSSSSAWATAAAMGSVALGVGVALHDVPLKARADDPDGVITAPCFTELKSADDLLHDDINQNRLKATLTGLVDRLRPEAAQGNTASATPMKKAIADFWNKKHPDLPVDPSQAWNDDSRGKRARGAWTSHIRSLEERLASPLAHVPDGIIDQDAELVQPMVRVIERWLMRDHPGALASPFAAALYVSKGDTRIFYQDMIDNGRSVLGRLSGAAPLQLEDVIGALVGRVGRAGGIIPVSELFQTLIKMYITSPRSRTQSRSRRGTLSVDEESELALQLVNAGALHGRLLVTFPADGGIGDHRAQCFEALMMRALKRHPILRFLVLNLDDDYYEAHGEDEFVKFSKSAKTVSVTLLLPGPMAGVDHFLDARHGGVQELDMRRFLGGLPRLSALIGKAQRRSISICSAAFHAHLQQLVAWQPGSVLNWEPSSSAVQQHVALMQERGLIAAAPGMAEAAGDVEDTQDEEAAGDVEDTQDEEQCGELGDTDMQEQEQAMLGAAGFGSIELVEEQAGDEVMNDLIAML